MALPPMFFFLPCIGTLYNMTFETADDVPFAGTDATVYVQLFGEKGQTEKIDFRSDSHLEAPKFKRGRIDKFAVETVDVGRVSIIEGYNLWSASPQMEGVRSVE